MTSEELQARLADLEYRLAELTGRYEETDTNDLLRLYLEALRIREPSTESAALLRVLLNRLTTSDLYRLGQLTRDPFAWKALVRLCLCYLEKGIDLEPVLDRLLIRAQSLLNAQGLSKLRPADLF